MIPGIYPLMDEHVVGWGTLVVPSAWMLNNDSGIVTYESFSLDGAILFT